MESNHPGFDNNSDASLAPRLEAGLPSFNIFYFYSFVNKCVCTLMITGKMCKSINVHLLICAGFWLIKLHCKKKKKSHFVTDLAETKSHGALSQAIICLLPWKGGYQCDIYIVANSQKKKEEMTTFFFPEHTRTGPKVSQPFPV